jgi:hypothetical protein
MFPVRVKEEKLRAFNYSDDELGNPKPEKQKKQPKKKPVIPKKQPKKKPVIPKKKPVKQQPRTTRNTRRNSTNNTAIGAGVADDYANLDDGNAPTIRNTTTTRRPNRVRYDENDGNTSFENSSMTTTNNNRPQSWFAKLLDYGLTQDAIRAQAAQIQNQASQSGQTINEAEALQQVAQNNNIPLGNSVGNQTGFAVDGILGWIKDNFLVVAAVLGGVWLAFRPPPGSKRN